MSQLSSRKKPTAVWFIVYKLWQDDAIVTEPLREFMVRNTNISRVLLSVCFRFTSYIHTHIHTYIHTHTYIHIYIHTHTHTHIYIYTHTHTHTHTYIYT